MYMKEKTTLKCQKINNLPVVT